MMLVMIIVQIILFVILLILMINNRFNYFKIMKGFQEKRKKELQ